MICVLYKYYLSTFRKLIIVADDTEIICDQYDQIFSKSCPKSFILTVTFQKLAQKYIDIWAAFAKKMFALNLPKVAKSGHTVTEKARDLMYV